MGVWVLANEKQKQERSMWSRTRPFSVSDDGSVIRITEDGTVVAVDLATGAERELAALHVCNVVRPSNLSPDRKFVVLDLGDGSGLFDTTSWTEIHHWPKRTALAWVGGANAALLGSFMPDAPGVEEHTVSVFDPIDRRGFVLATRATICDLSSRGMVATSEGRLLVALGDGSVGLFARDGTFVRTVFSAR